MESPGLDHPDDGPGRGGGLAAKEVLTAKKVAAPPMIDGKSETVWNTVRPVTINLPGKFTVTAKAVYTDTCVYFMFPWPDKYESLNRVRVFEKGRWQKKPGNEERFNLMWNINGSIAGFSEKGGQIVCHKNKETDEGQMYTNGPGERADFWHWNPQRTNPLGYADDRFVMNELDRSGEEATGRRADQASSGSFSANSDSVKNRPKFTSAKGKDEPVLLKKDAKEVSDATKFRDGPIVPQEVLEMPAGSRGDVAAKGIWKAGKWTLELARKLTTDHDDDGQFDDLSSTFRFGISVHNNAGGGTHATSEVIELKFK
ncbi:MAG: hypothetical protein HY423_10040 [Candidatus Lambdaproteobacteria bacterium]|nr:hypothetical protein [Candidatus Lambdaproteobacteria bacterium]